MHELLLRFNPPDTVYAMHQEVARLMARSRDDQRDYLYALAPDGRALYLRAMEPRPGIGNWRPYAMPQAGQSVRLSGVLYFDRSASRGVKGGSPSGAATQWNDPAWLVERVTFLLRRSGVDPLSVTASADGSVLLGKPGPRVVMTPIRFSADVTVSDAQAMSDMLRSGLGRGRAFGFGCVHWRDLPAS